MEKKYLKIFDYFFVLRPTLFYPVWTVALAGYWAWLRLGNQPITSDFILRVGSYDATYIFILSLLTLVMGASFLINQIEDAETDRLNNKLYLIANDEISIKQAYVETFILVALPLMVLWWVRQDLLLVTTLAFIITGLLYSCKPFLMKNRPIGGLSANILGYYIIFSIGWMIKGQAHVDMLLYATPYVFGILAVYFFTTIPDIAGDKAVNKITVAVKYGSYPIIIAGMVSNIVAIFLSGLTKDPVIFISSLAVLPFFIHTAITKSVAAVLRTNKFATLVLSLVISYRFPGYLVLIIIVFFFTRWYYKVRFNIVYPSFKSPKQ